MQVSCVREGGTEDERGGEGVRETEIERVKEGGRRREREREKREGEREGEPPRLHTISANGNDSTAVKACNNFVVTASA